jgi:uncharacterized protein (DUF58 family)
MPDTSAGPTDLIAPDLAARVRQLMLFSRFRVEGRFTGDNKSTRKGFSSDFLQHRQYFPGDNLKYLDWRVFARTGRWIIREYEETTNLDLYLVVDKSASMGRCGGDLTKDEYATRVAALLAYLMLTQKDSFGLSLFAAQLRTHVDPGTGRRHLRRVFEVLLGETPAGVTDWEAALRQVGTRFRRRGLVIVISDFMGEPAAIGRALAGFRSARCDVIAFHVVDPFEEELRANHLTRYVDVEDGSALTVDPLLLRRAYADEFRRHLEELRRELSARGVAHALIRAGADYEKALGDYLQKRAAFLL